MAKYYLWLTPEGEAGHLLAQVIRQLSQQYQGPCFDPHITLLGELLGDESLFSERANLLGKKLCPISIELQGPAFEDEYFRCLYFKVRKNSEILDAREQGIDFFCQKLPLPFNPHVSVLYGLFPARVKEEIIAALPSDLPKKFIVEELKLVRAESLNPQDWYPVETIRLQGLSD
ncbi:2'-5' RNA ligase family protein [Candidatus Nitronereus thalassa]|uniref:Cyclic phosphodiesterase-like protein n=1 Tax=Candidatus Nitronereus thalassa TaxID=3020898 RepID=A0ABU3KCV1_9BACT|nr:2'-5' RNA ligase family protein [Candidatus Nitronereus thalassa]MDT7044221.1 hypothetical protein [Candidatus Nitronereus thalassa]